MKLENIKDPSIAQQKYDNYEDIREKVPHDNWAQFINENLDYYTWLEGTDEGKIRLKNLNSIPESFKNKILNLHDKKRALAEYNSEQGYYEVIIDYIDKYGKISTTFQKPITKKHLQRLLDMANYLDAYLLNNGKDIIDE